MAQGKRRVKPVDYFPAKPRRDGRYQKFISGKFHYFGGPGISREQALAEYQRVRHQLYDGQAAPSEPQTDDYLLWDLRKASSYYLDARRRDWEAGTIKRVTYIDIRADVMAFCRRFGIHRQMSELKPDAFTEAANHFRNTLSPCRWNHMVAAVNGWLNYAYGHDWLKQPIRVGPRWKKIPQSQIPKRERVLSVAEFTALLNAAKDEWRAILLLSMNCGMGPNDLAVLELADIKNGVIDHLRPKTNIRRVAPLWPDTIEAIEDWLTLRNSPLPQLFITKYGRPWDAHDIGHEFKKLRETAGVDLGEKNGLYVFRHTFSSIADDFGDTNAKRLIMGHKFPGMDAVYVAKRLPRLRACVAFVAQSFTPPLRSNPAQLQGPVGDISVGLAASSVGVPTAPGMSQPATP